MNNASALVHSASKNFTVRNCNCYGATRIVSKNGFAYILVDKNKSKIIDNITIHYNKNREMDIIGQMDRGEVVIQTPTNLGAMFEENPQLFILKVNNDYFMVYSLLAYNEKMNQYDYRGEILQNKNKDFVVYDVSSIENRLINNSIPLWLANSETFGLDVFPSYLSPVNLEKKYISVEVINTRPLSMARLDNKEINQWKEDTIRVHAINLSLQEQQELAYKIQTLSIENNINVFGVMDFISFKSLSDDRQKGFGIVSNKAISDFRINYHQNTTSVITLEFIKQIIGSINDNKLILFNMEEI